MVYKRCTAPHGRVHSTAPLKQDTWEMSANVTFQLTKWAPEKKMQSSNADYHVLFLLKGETSHCTMNAALGKVQDMLKEGNHQRQRSRAELGPELGKVSILCQSEVILRDQVSLPAGAHRALEDLAFQPPLHSHSLTFPLFPNQGLTWSRHDLISTSHSDNVKGEGQN